MKPTLIIIAIVVSTLFIAKLALDSGWFLVPQWYQKPPFRSHKQSMINKLHGVSVGLEELKVPPSKQGEVLEEKSDRWGTPILYSYENGVAVLRSAGKDQKLNTKDDLMQPVRITSD